ncbi:hypothetical protein VTI74DRAFT_4475 [Chaetomium olivicolor]
MRWCCGLNMFGCVLLLVLIGLYDNGVVYFPFLFLRCVVCQDEAVAERPRRVVVGSEVPVWSWDMGGNMCIWLLDEVASEYPLEDVWSSAIVLPLSSGRVRWYKCRAPMHGMAAKAVFRRPPEPPLGDVFKSWCARTRPSLLCFARCPLFFRVGSGWQ